MKNSNLILLTVAVVFASVSGFSQAKISTISIEKTDRSAVMIQVEHPADLADKALEQRLKNAGLSGKSKGGFTVYKEAVLADLSPDKIDIYTKVEKATKSASIIYMTVSRGYDNFVNPETDKLLLTNITNFLNSMVKETSLFAFDLEIGAKQKEIVKEKERYKGLLDDQKDLERQKENMENKIQDKIKEINDKKAEIDKLQSTLENMNNSIKLMKGK